MRLLLYHCTNALRNKMSISAMAIKNCNQHLAWAQLHNQMGVLVGPSWVRIFLAL
jgi:hypothetical protein